MKLPQRLLILIAIASLLLAGCGTGQTVEPSATLQPSNTAVPPTATATTTLPPPTPTIKPSPTETLTPTPHPVATMSAVISVEQQNLRAGPSTIYAVLGSYPKSTELLVQARVPGNEWVHVQMPDGVTGWMSVEFLNLGEEVAYLPLEEVTESIVVSGRVIDSDAQPVNSVDVAVLQRLASANLRTDAISDKDGYFYAYIPKQSAGIWEAQIVGLLCTSQIVDANCNLKDHFLYNFRVIFEPPPLSPILFLYQVATAHITGTLTDANEKPVVMRVFVERSDGAYAFALTDANGNFSIPAGVGKWKVYAMQYNPNIEGEAVTVEILAGEEPAPISLKAPVPES